MGREPELVALAATVTAERLVTLHGPGGAGKTRLAVELVRRGATAQDVLLADLAPLPPGSPVWSELEQLVGARREPGETPAGAVERALRERALVLVLDNCEHVLEGAREVATALLPQCAGLTLLATSREPLGLPAEAVWPVPPLSLPPPAAGLEEAMEHDAARLFAERAARALPGFAPSEHDIAALVRICHRLDGIPLAIELAAARCNVLGPEEIAERLDDRFRLLSREDPARPPRQRTLRALVDWSYELLGPAEQRLLAGLSVFAGGFELDAAEAVCAADDLAADDVIDVLAGLVEKALVARGARGGRARFRLHETIHDYARERLEAQGDPEALSARHLDWCRALAAGADEGWLREGGAAQLDRVRAEQDNVRHALAWGLATGRAAEALELAWRFANFWGTWGRLDEAATWLERALTATSGAPPSVDRARAVTRAGTFAEARGDWELARSRYEQALAMATEIGDAVRLGVSLLALADLSRGQAKLDEARAHAEQGLRALHGSGDRERVRWLVEALGRIDLAAGDAGAALDRFETSRAEAVALGNETSMAWIMSLLAEAEREAGDRLAARAHLEEALGLASRHGDREAERNALLSLGRLELHAGAPGRARERLAAALRLVERSGARPAALDCLQALAAAQPDPRAGARLLGAAEALRERHGIPCEPRERGGIARLSAELQRALGPEPFATVHGAGRALGWSDAVAEALRAPAATGPEPGEPIEVILRREGDVWTLSSRERAVRLRDSKGLGYLAALIAAAGREIPALELAGGRLEEHGSELLDDSARAAYRSRLAELEEELDEARRFADPERAARLGEERDALYAELSAAVGLGGRARRSGSSSERARKAVTNRIRDALARVEAEEPELGAHLRRSVSTGGTCSYRPEPRSPWSLRVA